MKYKYCHCFLEYKNFKVDLTNVYVVTKIINKFADRKDFLTHSNFLTMMTICLFYCCEKVFILMDIWMIGKNPIIQKGRFLQSLKYVRYY